MRFVVACKLPDVPVIVSVYCPSAAVLLAVKVSWLFPVVGLGEKEAVTPLGRLETDIVTLPVNPYCGVMSTYVLTEVPCPTVTLPEL